MYIGIDVGGTNLVAGLTDEEGRLLAKVGCPVDRSWTSEEICHQAVVLARQAVQEGGAAFGEIRAVGVGLPGLVDNHSGMVVDTPNINLSDTPFRALFQQEWEVPVFLGNDANCAAIGEYWAGAAKGCDPAVVITLGTGIGGGLVAGGKLVTGFAGGGMEVGHICIHPEDRLCGCGHRGCWEQYGSATALIRLTREKMEQDKQSLLWDCAGGTLDGVTGRTPFQAAAQGDDTAKQVLEQYRRDLALGIVNLINILQPEVLCLGGGVSNAPDELLLEPLRELVDQGRFDRTCPLRLERAALGNDAGVVGAAMLCKVC